MDLTESYFDTQEVGLHFVEGPRNGPALVLLHGATGSYEDYLNILPNLVENWHVFALDLRGHGQSSWAGSPDAYNIQCFVRDVLVFLRQRACEKSVLYGHSWGALTALLAASEAADCLRAVIAEDPPLLVRRVTEEVKATMDYFAWALKIKETLSGVDEIANAIAEANGLRPEDVGGWAYNLQRLDPDFLRAMLDGGRAAEGVDMAARLDAIAIPTLLLQADPANGGILPPVDADFALQHIRGARLEFFPGAGHGIHTDQPDKVLRVAEVFLRENQ